MEYLFIAFNAKLKTKIYVIKYTIVNQKTLGQVTSKNKTMKEGIEPYIIKIKPDKLFVKIIE